MTCKKARAATVVLVMVLICGGFMTSLNLAAHLDHQRQNASLSGPDPMHFADSKGAYGLVAPESSFAPAIDGVKDPGEWAGTRYDVVEDGSGTSVMNVSVRHDSTMLHILVEVLLDDLGDPTDYCELAFDSDHDGDGLDSFDKRIRLQFDGTPYAYTGDTGIWTPGAVDWSGAVGDNPIVYEFEIGAFEVWSGTIAEGGISGFLVHIYSGSTFGTVEDAYGYWPDDYAPNAGEISPMNPIDDSSNWGDLFYSNPRLVINEVAPLGTDNSEWVELYNAGSHIELRGINITDQDGNYYEFFSLPMMLPRNAYLVLRSGLGMDDMDFSDGNGTIHMGFTPTWDADALGDSDDVLLRYGGNDCGIDFMNYTDHSTFPDPVQPDTKSHNGWSLSLGGWLPSPSSEEVSLARMPNGLDTNDSVDWAIISYKTEGSRNAMGTSSPGYGLVAGESSVAPTMDGRVSPPEEWSDSRFDVVNDSGNDYFSVRTTVVGDFLYVSLILDPTFDSVMDENDFCAIGFDTNHKHGTAPQPDDWYVRVSFDGLVLQKQALRGTGTSWSPEIWPPGWDAVMDDSGPERVCEFKVDAGMMFDGNEGQLIGFGVQAYDNDTGDRAYWPDAVNPTQNPEMEPGRWGHLIYGRPTLLVNRLSPFGSGQGEGVELRNNRSTDIEVHNMTLGNLNGINNLLPQITLPPYGSLFVRGGKGFNDFDFTDGFGTFHTGSGTDVWNDTGDDVHLSFWENGCTLDYMQYGTGPEVNGHPPDSASNSFWTQDAAVIPAPLERQYLYRDPMGMDTNSSSDWQISEFEVRNIFYLHDDGSYEGTDNYDIANTTEPMNPADTDYEGAGEDGVLISRMGDPQVEQRFQIWNVTPAFARAFSIFHEVKVVLWINASSNPPQQLNLTASLYNSTGFMIGAATYSPNTWPQGWTEATFEIGVFEYDIDPGDYIYLKVNRTDDYSPRVYVMFDADWAPSRIAVDTQTFVDVDWMKYYDAITGIERSPSRYFLDEDVKIRAMVSDPVGSFDITYPGLDMGTSGANISIWAPGDPLNPIVENETMTWEATDTSSPSAWKMFKYIMPKAMITETGTYTARVKGWAAYGIGDNYTTTFQVLAQSPLDHIELTPFHIYPDIKSVNAGGILTYTARGWNDPGRTEQNITWEPLWNTTDKLGSANETGGDWLNGYTAEFRAGLVPGFDNITVEGNATGISAQSTIGIMPNELDHIELVPMHSYPSSTRPVNAGGLLTDYIAKGYNDPSGFELNCTWRPAWNTTDNLGDATWTGGDCLNGYTADYLAGFSPGLDNITVTDENATWVMSKSAISIRANGLHHIRLVPRHPFQDPVVIYAGTTLYGFNAIAYNDAAELEVNTTWDPDWNTTDFLGAPTNEAGDPLYGHTADYLAYLSPGFDNITIRDRNATWISNQSAIEIRGNPMDHIVLTPLKAFPDYRPVKAGGILYDYIAVGWNDPGRTEKNQTWKCKWGVTDFLGTAEDLGGNWDEGYFAKYKAGFVPGYDNITAGDKTHPDISTKSSIRISANELDHIELIPMNTYPSAAAVAAGGLLNYLAVGWNDPLKYEKNRTWNRTWGTTDGYGAVKDTGGNWDEGYTAEYTAGTTPAFDNITVEDKAAPAVGRTISCIQIVAGPPHEIVIVSGALQNGTAGTSLQDPLVVEVRDQYGNPVSSGWPVWFNITTTGLNGDGYLNTTNPVVTNAGGSASTRLTLDTMAGTNTVTAETGGSGNTQIVFQASGNLPRISTNLAANATSVLRGNTFYYIISLNNKGTEAATNVLVNDTFPNSLNYVSDTSGATRMVTGNKYTWIFPTLPKGPFSFIVTLMVSASTPGGTKISNKFTVDYSDMAGNPQPRETSNTVTVTILSEPITNIPPTIDGVPDLFVHYEFDYVMDLSPYIDDPDSNQSELFLILSDTLNVRVDPSNNLGIILNYSAGYLGTTQVLNITVSDGLGSDWDVINVRVTDEFPPRLKEFLPNVFLDEDSVSFPFNITEYFDDRGGIVNYSAVGNVNLDISFLSNGTIYLVPVANWFGLEKVIFRATTPLGAFVEDRINVTVNPINDAPFIFEISNQSGQVGRAWTLDLSPFIQDIDNLLVELLISTDSPSVTVNGLNLTFRFTSEVELDIITVTASDGQAQAYRQISVTVAAAGFMDGIWPWLLALLALALSLAALAMYLRRGWFVVDDAFLMYNDGRLLSHVARRVTPDMDSEIFSSMLTAIQDFVTDSFNKDSDWDVNKIEFRNRRIAIEKSESGLVSLALIYQGKGKEERLNAKAKAILEDVEEKYGAALKDWDGSMDDVEGVRDIIAGALKRK